MAEETKAPEAVEGVKTPEVGKAEAVQGQPAANWRAGLPHCLSTGSLATIQRVFSSDKCAIQAGALASVRTELGRERVDALDKLLKAKAALTTCEGFYILGMDPLTLLPYLSGKNESQRDAQLVQYTKTERDAVTAAEVALARAEVEEDGVVDDLDACIAALYVHAAHGFRGFSDAKQAEPKAEPPPDVEPPYPRE